MKDSPKFYFFLHHHSWFILSIVLFGFFQNFVYSQEAASSWIQNGDIYEEKSGQGLYLKTSPGGARVFIDGIERGVTPYRPANLRPGDYFIRLVKDGYKERRFRISLHPGSLLELDLELEKAVGTVMVQVAAADDQNAGMLPLKPRIYAEGREAESSSLLLPAGMQTVSVRAFGWEDQTASVYVAEDSFQTLVFTLKPAVFRLGTVSLNRKKLNPSNAGSLGTTELTFTVSAPGTGSLDIVNGEGRNVFSRELGYFTDWTQSVKWNGRDARGDALADGVYHMTLKVWSVQGEDSMRIDDSCVLEVFIDSSSIIRPLSVSSGKSGLLFAPSPDLLPPRAFQVEGSILFGNPLVQGSENTAAWRSLPFAAAFRFSPLAFLEVAAALNVQPVFEKGAYPAFGGSLKWTFINPSVSGFSDRLVPGLALCTVFSWAQNSSITAFGMGSGIELGLPFSAAYSGFSLHFSPGIIWTGDNGFPWEGLPRFLLSGGIMFSIPGFSAGVSLRSENRYLLNESKFADPLLLIGGEIKIFPSSPVFSVMGGIRKKGSALGGFGGAGIGIIY